MSSPQLGDSVICTTCMGFLPFSIWCFIMSKVLPLCGVHFKKTGPPSTCSNCAKFSEAVLGAWRALN
eukprot:7313645-Alexandrium_andersonii.AAC.1